MLYKRVISGLLFLPVFYFVVWKLAPAYFVTLLAIAALIGQFEFYRMVKNRGVRPLVVTGMILGALIVVLLPGMNGIFFITLSLFLVLLVRLFAPRPVEGAAEDIAATFLGIFYVALLFGFQTSIRMAPGGKQWIVFLFFVIWATDIGAYSIGIPFGRHKLYPKVSPNKSIEGLLGGVVAAAGMALLCRVWFMQSTAMGMGEAAALGTALALAGTLGDLVESLFKRSTGVKDSGRIIPGHGGMLDRMDSMLFAAPVLYYYITR